MEKIKKGLLYQGISNVCQTIKSGTIPLTDFSFKNNDNLQEGLTLFHRFHTNGFGIKGLFRKMNSSQQKEVKKNINPKSNVFFQKDVEGFIPKKNVFFLKRETHKKNDLLGKKEIFFFGKYKTEIISPVFPP